MSGKGKNVFYKQINTYKVNLGVRKRCGANSRGTLFIYIYYIYIYKEDDVAIGAASFSNT